LKRESDKMPGEMSVLKRAMFESGRMGSQRGDNGR
jgi:hypothetical protein